MAVCSNDIKVVEASSLSNRIANGEYPPSVQYKRDGELRTVPYWLADGIYTQYPFFVQTVQNTVTKKENVMSKMQEGGIKNAERGFGVLEGKLHILVR